MELRKLTLENYRGIESLSLDLEGKSVVLFGVNGAGKSSLLKSINLLFAQIIHAILGDKAGEPVAIIHEDLRYGADKYAITGEFSLEHDSDMTYSLSYDGESHKADRGEDVLAQFRSYYETHFLREHPTSYMPIFVYYGVHRAVQDSISVRDHEGKNWGSLEAFWEASPRKIDFKTFFEWYRSKEDMENEEIIGRRDFDYRDPTLQAVRSAMMAMLPISDIKVRRSPLGMVATKAGKVLAIEQLSDGEKCVLSLLGDLVRRLSLANPTMENPLLGCGIALIDEVELHMHPLWQRRIMPLLQEIFPNMQFIVTTHSPQVLGELNEDFTVIHLMEGEGGKVETVYMRPGYYDVNLILEDYMGVSSVNPQISILERDIFAAIGEKDFVTAGSLVQKLEKLTHGTNASISRARILIGRGERK